MEDGEKTKTKRKTKTKKIILRITGIGDHVIKEEILKVYDFWQNPSFFSLMEPPKGNPPTQPKSTQEQDQILRSNKKPKRKITSFIFDGHRRHDEQMADADQPNHENLKMVNQQDNNEGNTPLSFRDMLKGGNNCLAPQCHGQS